MKFKTLLMMGLFSMASLSFADSTMQYPSYAPFKGLEFEHHDWQVSCDNIGTCRIAGYHDDEEIDNRLVSVLLTRTIDDKKPIQGVVKVELLYDTVFDYILPLEMKINGKSYGQLGKVKDEHLLNGTQIQALIQYANQNAKIEFIAGEYIWQLSDKGMSAVLLKADEYQQRVNTPSAWIKKGNQANPQGHYYMPSMKAKVLPKQLNQRSIPWESKQGQALVKILAKTVDTRDVVEQGRATKPACRDLIDTKFVHSPAFHVIDVSKTQKLVSYQCWSGAYNTGYGAWLMNYDLSQVQQLVTVHASDVPDRQYPNNKIMANHKSRGIGDCWVNQTWIWNGQKFIKTYAGSTGMCRGFAGGAWVLPTYSVDLDNNKSQRAILSNGSSK